MFKKCWAIALLLLASTFASAQETSAPNGTLWNDYHTADHFQWGDYDNTVHIAAGFTISYVGANMLSRWVKLPLWESVALATLGSISIGALRETFQDFTSKKDIQCWSIGAAGGGLTYTVVNF